MTHVADDIQALKQHLKPGLGGRGRRSTLFRWMFKRADAFNRMLNDTQPSWASIADAAVALGLTDGAGKRPTAERARKTWFEVRRAKGWHLVSEPAPMPGAISTRPAAVAPALPPFPVADAAGGDVEFEFRTLRSQKD
jgi:hypothetical protein